MTAYAQLRNHVYATNMQWQGEWLAFVKDNAPFNPSCYIKGFKDIVAIMNDVVATANVFQKAYDAVDRIGHKELQAYVGIRADELKHCLADAQGAMSYTFLDGGSTIVRCPISIQGLPLAVLASAKRGRAAISIEL